MPALGYVVSYRALQAAIDAELARTRTDVRYDSPVATVGDTPTCASVRLDGRRGDAVAARLAVVADGTGAAVAGVSRERRDYGQVALIAKVDTERPHDRCGLRAVHGHAAPWRCCPKAITTGSSGR